MCNFFSFVTFNGKPYYFNARQRRDQIVPDSHSGICCHYGLPCDKVNKYEFGTNRGFRIDQINAKRDDSRWAEAWVKEFSKTKQFSDICAKELRFIPSAIRFIRNPTEAQKLKAVRSNGLMIQYIKNPSEAVRVAAVEEDCYAIEHIKNPSEKVQLAVIKCYPGAIGYIKRPTKRVQIEVVSANPFLIKYIKKPCKEAKEIARKDGI